MRSGLALAALVALCLVSSACSEEPASQAAVSSGSEDAASTETDWDASDPVAWRLAVVDSDDPSYPTGGVLVAEFQSLLDSVGSRTLLTDLEIMDTTVEVWREAAARGHEATLLDTMRSLEASFTPGAANQGHDYDDIAAAYLADLSP